MKNFKNYSDQEILDMAKNAIRETASYSIEYEYSDSDFWKKWLDCAILKFNILIAECERRGIDYSNYITL